ncbi:hypothetical protein Athai_47190 [Actinocatenispora thailandica]|uniref:Uncharacterized protein n=1 Tax=Actinocatenispora thailandica TaxID=227318 RepID=A0A7R7DT18_9ACTN|nr:hypothetical protein Athai_47190 [Actinocatenispora thailandica]
MTSPVTRNRVKFELLPLVDKYLDEHPELVRQYSSAPKPLVPVAPSRRPRRPNLSRRPGR